MPTVCQAHNNDIILLLWHLIPTGRGESGTMGGCWMVVGGYPSQLSANRTGLVPGERWPSGLYSVFISISWAYFWFSINIAKLDKNLNDVSTSYISKHSDKIFGKGEALEDVKKYNWKSHIYWINSISYHIFTDEALSHIYWINFKIIVIWHKKNWLSQAVCNKNYRTCHTLWFCHLILTNIFWEKNNERDITQKYNCLWQFQAWVKLRDQQLPWRP